MTSNPLIGIGLRYPHTKLILDEKPKIDWFEVHSENFFQNRAQSQGLLLKISEQYPISLHGVGLSLGSPLLSKSHLNHLKNLVETVNPLFVSEHLSWNTFGNIALPDLLPAPYTRESYEVFYKNIQITQEYLKREILIENPSSYLEYKDSVFAEVDFLVSLCQETGAKILLDINNVYVSCKNHGWDPIQYLEGIPTELVKEIHIAGHSEQEIDEETTLLVDTHDCHVCDEVWALYTFTIDRFGRIPTLLEWDAKIPSLPVLIEEAQKALQHMPQIEIDYAKA